MGKDKKDSDKGKTTEASEPKSLLAKSGEAKPAAPVKTPIVDPESLASRVANDQVQGGMVVSSCEQISLTKTQMQEAIDKHPDNPIAIAFAKGIAEFPDKYKKKFHINKIDFDALMVNKTVKAEIKVVNKKRVQHKTIVDL